MRTLIVAATLTLTACAGDATQSDSPGSERSASATKEKRKMKKPRDDDARRYVVPLGRSAEFARALGVNASATFEPDPTAVDDFEAELAGFLATSELPAAPRIAAALPRYRRQFLGVEREGRVLILGNFFRTDDDAREPVSVDDGGETYFQISYEPKTKRFSGLMINGEA